MMHIPYSPPISTKFTNVPLLPPSLYISPIYFHKIDVFFASPILTMAHQCIMLCTYWTSLHFNHPISSSFSSNFRRATPVLKLYCIVTAPLAPNDDVAFAVSSTEGASCCRRRVGASITLSQ